MEELTDETEYICIIPKKVLDKSPTSLIQDDNEISSYYTNGQTYVHVRMDRFKEYKLSDTYKELKIRDKMIEMILKYLKTFRGIDLSLSAFRHQATFEVNRELKK